MKFTERKFLIYRSKLWKLFKARSVDAPCNLRHFKSRTRLVMIAMMQRISFQNKRRKLLCNFLRQRRRVGSIIIANLPQILLYFRTFSFLSKLNDFRKNFIKFDIVPTCYIFFGIFCTTPCHDTLDLPTVWSWSDLNDLTMFVNLPNDSKCVA